MKTLIRLNRTGIAMLNFPIIQIYRTTKHKKGVPHKNEQKLANKEHNTTRGTTKDDTLKNKDHQFCLLLEGFFNLWTTSGSSSPFFFPFFGFVDVLTPLLPDV